MSDNISHHSIIIVASLLMMLLASPQIPSLIFPGMILMAIGGGQLIPSNMQVSILDPKHLSSKTDRPDTAIRSARCMQAHCVCGEIPDSGIMVMLQPLAYYRYGYSSDVDCII